MVTRSDRDLYLEILGAADNGELAPLVSLVGDLQHGRMDRAFGLCEQT